MSNTVAVASTSQASAPAEPPNMDDANAVAFLVSGVVFALLAWRWGLRVAAGYHDKRAWRIATGLVAACMGLVLGSMSWAFLYALGLPFPLRGLLLAVVVVWALLPSRLRGNPLGIAGVFVQALIACLGLAVSSVAALMGRLRRLIRDESSLFAQSVKQICESERVSGPANFPNSCLDDDSLFGGVAPGSNFDIPARVEFTYVDANGNFTERRVRVTLRGDQSFKAYCYMRRAERTFRYDRIVGDVVDTETGEIFSVEAWRP